VGALIHQLVVRRGSSRSSQELVPLPGREHPPQAGTIVEAERHAYRILGPHLNADGEVVPGLFDAVQLDADEIG
jgi:hypothetical protein